MSVGCLHGEGNLQSCLSADPFIRETCRDLYSAPGYLYVVTTIPVTSIHYKV